MSLGHSQQTNEDEAIVRVWRALLDLSRDLTTMQQNMLALAAVLEAALGIEIIPRPEVEKPARHLRLVVSRQNCSGSTKIGTGSSRCRNRRKEQRSSHK